MRVMKLLFLFLLLWLILLPSFALFRMWREDQAYRYVFPRYFGVEYPYDEEMREATLPIVTEMLYLYRSHIPDLELQSLGHDVERAERHMDGTPQSFENLRVALARRDALARASRSVFFDFAAACEIAAYAYDTRMPRYGPMKGAKKMLHDADCPQKDAHR